MTRTITGSVGDVPESGICHETLARGFLVGGSAMLADAALTERATKRASAAGRPAEVAPPSGELPVQKPAATYRQIWTLAWPVSISTATLTLTTVANLFWIGRLGTVALAAVTLAHNIIYNVYSASQLVYSGALPIVARRVGEGDRAKAFNAVVHAVYLAVLMASGIAAIGYVSAPAIVRFFTAGADVEASATSYLRIVLLGQIFSFVMVALTASYQATGDTRTPMLFNVAVVVLNAVLDPFFIFSPRQVVISGIPLGWLGWGVDGAAFAALLSGMVGCLGFLATSFFRGTPFPRPSNQKIVLRLGELWPMIRIGTPGSAQWMARSFSGFLLFRIVASFGVAAIAAYGIASRVLLVNFILYSGINTAISALVGQNLGRRNIREAVGVIVRGLVIDTLLGVFFCVAYYTGSERIILAFAREPDVIAAGVPYLKLMAFGFLFAAPMYPLVSAMNGAGDTKPPMIASLAANWPVKLTLCYALAIPFAYGINGVWVGIFLAMVFEALVIFGWYQLGTWKTKKL